MKFKFQILNFFSDSCGITLFGIFINFSKLYIMSDMRFPNLSNIILLVLIFLLFNEIYTLINKREITRISVATTYNSSSHK